MSFDWEQVTKIGFCPVEQFDPSITPNNIESDIYDLDIGKTPVSKPNEFAIFIDGISFNLQTESIEASMKVIDDRKKLAENEKKIFLKLADESIQFIELDGILSDLELNELRLWIRNKKTSLITIAKEYEANNRQYYHFMYDLIALWKTLREIPKKFHPNLIETIDAGDKLMHNRILGEIASEYIKKGSTVEIEPGNVSNSSNPDLLIGNTIADVKTILTTVGNDRESCSDFAYKLSKDIINKEKTKGQIGKGGTFFIAPWSGIINSIFYTYFHKMKIEGKHNFEEAKYYDVIPPLRENSAVFVLTSKNAFENSYLVFDTKWVSNIIEDFVEQGYPTIRKFEPLSYLFYSNIRKGFPLGIQGENSNLMIYVR